MVAGRSAMSHRERWARVRLDLRALFFLRLAGCCVVRDSSGITPPSTGWSLSPHSISDLGIWTSNVAAQQQSNCNRSA